MNTNPFAFGALALDRAFADRARELADLTRDMRNGQDVVVIAPRRYGKSSLVLRAIEEVVAAGVIVAYCDLMKTPTKERFAASLAKAIVDDLDSPVGQVLERAAALFRGLRLRPVMELDPDDASVAAICAPETLSGLMGPLSPMSFGMPNRASVRCSWSVRRIVS